MKKRLLVIVGVAVFGVFGWLWLKPNLAQATVDTCNQYFTYEKSSDYSDYRLNINFRSSDEAIDVSAQTGYLITRVWLDVQGDGRNGYFQYASGPMSNFNPNPGNDIDEVKVEVKKVCLSPTATPTQTPSPTCRPSPSLTPTNNPTPTEVPEPTPTEVPEVTPEPTQEPEPTPEPTDEPEVTPEPTNKPVVTPEPTQKPDVTPVPSDVPSTNKESTLDISPTSCVDYKFTATMTLKDDGKAQENVKVTFKYKDQVQEARTDRDGKASVTFNYVDDSGVEATPEAFNSHTKSPTPAENCGDVLGASTTGRGGAVLGYAATGMPYAILGLYVAGLSMIAGGGVSYARSQKQK